MTFSLSWKHLKVLSVADAERAMDHLERELDKVRDLQQVTFSSVVTSDYRAKPGEFVIVDPRGGALSIFLPSAKDNPDSVVIVRNLTSSTNAITLRAHPGEQIGYSSPADTITMSTAFARRDLLALRPPHSCFERVE